MRAAAEDSSFLNQVRSVCVLLNLPLCAFVLLAIAGVQAGGWPDGLADKLALLTWFTPPVGIILGLALRRSHPVAAAISAALPVLILGGLIVWVVSLNLSLPS